MYFSCCLQASVFNLSLKSCCGRLFITLFVHLVYSEPQIWIQIEWNSFCKRRQPWICWNKMVLADPFVTGLYMNKVPSLLRKSSHLGLHFLRVIENSSNAIVLSVQKVSEYLTCIFVSSLCQNFKSSVMSIGCVRTCFQMIWIVILYFCSCVCMSS